jgi:SAM-dependent methyltransferase
MILEFNKRYMKKRLYISWRADIIARAIADVLQPTEVLDLGCATGDYAAALNDLGILTLGVDASRHAGECLDKDHFMVHDLMNPLPPIGADLVILLEVLSVVYDPSTILDHAAASSRRLLLANHLTRIPDEFEQDRVMTELLRAELEPWRDAQAIKALQRTGTVLRRKNGICKTNQR